MHRQSLWAVPNCWHCCSADKVLLLHVQTKQFADKDNADLFAEEAAAQREVSHVVN
jgi:hypothetical protein